MWDLKIHRMTQAVKNGHKWWGGGMFDKSGEGFSCFIDVPDGCAWWGIGWEQRWECLFLLLTVLNKILWESFGMNYPNILSFICYLVISIHTHLIFKLTCPNILFICIYLVILSLIYEVHRLILPYICYYSLILGNFALFTLVLHMNFTLILLFSSVTW